MTERRSLTTFMAGTIQPKTKKEYGRGPESFAKYIKERGDDTSIRDRVMSNLTIHQQRTELAQFAMILSEEKGMTEGEYEKRFAGVRRDFLDSGRDIEAFSGDVVKEARQAGRIVVAAKRKIAIERMSPEERRKHDAKHGPRVPFTASMVKQCRIQFWDNKHASIIDNMAYVAIAVGIHIGNRPGELSSTGGLMRDEKGKRMGDHRFKVEDVRYQSKIGNFMDATQVNIRNKNDVIYVSLMVDSHKGERIGKKVKEVREPNGVSREEEGLEAELCTDLAEWAIRAQLQKGDFFFSRNIWLTKGRWSNLKLQKSEIRTRMKWAAQEEGVDPQLISCKSLRKGMACALSKTPGIGKEAVNRLGRWAHGSTASERYIHTSSVTGALSKGVAMVTTLDVSRMSAARMR